MKSFRVVLPFIKNTVTGKECRSSYDNCTEWEYDTMEEAQMQSSILAKLGIDNTIVSIDMVEEVKPPPKPFRVIMPTMYGEVDKCITWEFETEEEARKQCSDITAYNYIAILSKPGCTTTIMGRNVATSRTEQVVKGCDQTETERLVEQAKSSISALHAELNLGALRERDLRTTIKNLRKGKARLEAELFALRKVHDAECSGLPGNDGGE